jgi:hypothetical protein
MLLQASSWTPPGVPRPEVGTLSTDETTIGGTEVLAAAVAAKDNGTTNSRIAAAAREIDCR